MLKWILPIVVAIGGVSSSFAEEAAIGLDGARHLLGRTGFAVSNADIQVFSALTRSDAADRLIKSATATTVAITPPPAWVTEPPMAPAKLRALSLEKRQVEQRRNVEHASQLREWWFREMLSTPSPLKEKMTLFWHNHFATSQQKVRFTPLLYRQNLLLRRNALGNFGSLLREIARDPAMLIYLDGVNSRKEQPNENFAREVMELFTLGEGNYGERDVKEAARAFTGWSVDRDTGDFMFRRAIHDGGSKTVLGKSGNFDGDQVIDVLLNRPETALFIARKLSKEFVSAMPDEREVIRLAVIFRASGYDIAKLMRAILTSDAFYALANRAALIKSPVEFVVGTMKTFEIETPNLRPFVIASALLGQNLFTPPNVKGWPGGEAWINSATLLGRKQLLDRLFKNEDRMDIAMRSVDEMAAANGDAPPPGRDARMQRQMERQMGGIRWNLDNWTKGFVDAPRGLSVATGVPQMTRVVLPMAPMRPLIRNDNPADLVRQLVTDPAYQLK